jgi:nitroreductase
MKLGRKDLLPSNIGIEYPDTLTLIKERRSIRAFTDEDVPEELVRIILNVSKYAPSGTNTQPWNVAVVKGMTKRKIGDMFIKAKEGNVTPNPDYEYYPKEWVEPYLSRRKECGALLYNALKIKFHEKQKRKIAWYKNYRFFDAPVGLIFYIEKKLEKGSWMDIAMFMQNCMLAARAVGLETCPQAAFSEYPDIIRNILNISDNYAIVSGMALGFADYENPINQYRTPREDMDNFTKFYD